ncbi:hypothetical protein EFK50_19920 [Nocardioides marmoriginsengisoli]|uniref:Peptidase inhibitor family I36 protein n=1 Tax=Nocardioides marmoriginsengisoli TaxID=661483 RepID=A0A3N0CAV0_9ACTN|nr:peptidase inhibitor family I36 protein [Nocardioides marmoriginsengisoli]RNL60585.1 hypothetical protein EFK50_19920 [Nocardioides marmoriginsengisoli]
MTRIRFLLAPTLAALAIGAGAIPVGATTAPAPAATATAQSYLRDHPGGVLRTDHEVVYPDGSGFVAVPADTMSLSECSSGRFCMWTSASYTGSFSYVTGSGVTKPLSTTVKSFWNNRGQAARLYNNAATSSTCYAAGDKKSSLTVGYQQPAKVQLSAGASC